MARGHILQPVGQIGVVRGGWCSRHQHPEAALAVVEAWQRLVLDGLIVNWPSKDPRYDTQGHGEMFQLTPRRATSRETSRLRARPTWRAGARGPAPPRDCPGSTGRLRGEWALPRAPGRPTGRRRVTLNGRWRGFVGARWRARSSQRSRSWPLGCIGHGLLSRTLGTHLGGSAGTRHQPPGTSRNQGSGTALSLATALNDRGT